MRNSPSRTVVTPAFFLLLFFSGFASLMYEVIWTRTLLSTFGATVYASGTVLTSFMAGLAIGSYWAGRLVDRSRAHPLRVYAVLELLIGLFALVFPLLLKGITAIHIGAFRSLGSSFYLLSLVRFALAFVALLFPAILMGATLPVVIRQGVRRMPEVGAGVGRFYAINTIGAALGTFATGYFFIEWLGLRGASLLAVALNVIVFAGAIVLAKRVAAPDAEEPVETADGHQAPTVVQKAAKKRKSPGKKEARGKQAARKTKKIPAAAPLPPPLAGGVDRTVVLLAIAISGCCALAYEVLWARILVYVLGNFVHSFSIMLSTFLVGIALGSFVLGRVADRVRRPMLLFAGFQLVIGLSAILILPAFDQIIIWRDKFLDSMTLVGSMDDYQSPWWTFTFWKLATTFLLMIIPTFFMGASFPLANRLYIRGRETLGRGVGAVYASNTVGSIVGAFAASFVLIPLIGLRSAALVAVSLNLLAAAVLFSRREGRWAPLRLAGMLAGVLAIVWLSTVMLPREIFHPIFAKAEKGKRLIYVDEAVSGTVTIHETPGGFRVIDINGLNVAGTKFGFLCTQKLQAHFPLLMHPDPARVMQIGFGTGGTCFSVSIHPEVERIDCVEINPGIIEAAPYFLPNNQNILDDPRVNVEIEDARNYVLATDRRYDVILSDSIHPRFTGNGMLYTSDYFEMACSRPGCRQRSWEMKSSASSFAACNRSSRTFSFGT
ncbi:fused MFS/spermidine synthase [Candidatus Eisenbacteria bacterium]|uniref:Fused MFS/spermidine synthase n=1 Tax=Eiseniibacteriota bacterium TaxID=2212470 RepID=A0ABV6YL98_UNCEI